MSAIEDFAAGKITLDEWPLPPGYEERKRAAWAEHARRLWELAGPASRAGSFRDAALSVAGARLVDDEQEYAGALDEWRRLQGGAADA